MFPTVVALLNGGAADRLMHRACSVPTSAEADLETRRLTVESVLDLAPMRAVVSLLVPSFAMGALPVRVETDVSAELPCDKR